MSLVQLVAHFINLLLFMYAWVLLLRLCVMTWKSPLAAIYKEIQIKECIAWMFLSTLFVLLQADWIINSMNEMVGDVRSWIWLLFDYCLAIAICYHVDKERLRVIQDITTRCPYVPASCRK